MDSTLLVSRLSTKTMKGLSNFKTGVPGELGLKSA
uniref:Uncharacterized protein n=1 Tax=Anguilla anguilla TaxID=7936 RepID=A0A0E9TJX0_ANGAN